MSSNAKINKPVVICIFGPTGVGKTELLLSLNPEVYEVINADSLQAYQKLSIGTAKPTIQEQQYIKHWGYDILDPSEDYSVGKFIKITTEYIEDILRRHKIPVVSGGTAFYFKSLIEGAPSTPEIDNDIRKRVQKELGTLGSNTLYGILKQVDPTSKVNSGDTYRITRALEIYYQTGIPQSLYKASRMPRPYEYRIIGLDRPRADLYQRINKRVDIMFDKGLIQEIKNILKEGISYDAPAFKAIGYKEVLNAIDQGCICLEMIKNNIKQNSRQYAKRQLTFFRSLTGVKWCHPDNTLLINDLIGIDPFKGISDNDGSIVENR